MDGKLFPTPGAVKLRESPGKAGGLPFYLLMLAPQERGQGLGERIYKTLEQWVTTQGTKSLRLIVQAQNVRGLVFWRRVKFESEGTTTQEIEARTTTVYKMVKYLAVAEERAV